MIKRLFTLISFTLLLAADIAVFAASAPQTGIVANAGSDSEAAAQEAQQGERALENGDMEAALGHFLAAHELNPNIEEYLLTAAALAEEVDFIELAIELNATSVQLAVASGDVSDVSRLNEEITRLLSAVPQSVQQKLIDASGFSADQEDGYAAWQEMTAMAETSANEGAIEAALEAQENAVMVAQEVFGESHWITASSLRDLGYLYLQTGRADEAEQFYSQAMAIAQQAIGDNHPQTVEIQELLAGLYESSSDLEAAGFMYELIAAAYAESLGSSHSSTLTSGLALVRNYASRGLYAQGSALLRDLCPTFVDSFGTYHPQSLDCLQQQASLLTDQDKLEEAEALYAELVAHMQSSFTGPNSMVFAALRQLSEVYRKQGRYAGAKELLAGIISAGEQIGDVETVAQAKSYLARVFNNEGDFERAELLTEKVLAYGQVNWQNTPLDLLNTLLELGAIYKNQGKLGEAEITYEEALQGFLVLVGDSHQSTLVAMNNLGQVYEKQGLYDLAEPVLKDALAQLERVLGAEHQNSASARSNLALLHESQGNFREAEPLYVKTLALLARTQGDDHTDTIAVRNNLAFLYMLMEDYDRAAPLFEQVRQQWTLQFGEGHQNTLKASNNLARVYHKQNRLPEAEQIFELTLELRKSTLIDEHLDTMRSMIDLGALYIDQGRLQEAEKLLQEARSLLEKVLGEQHPYTFEAINHLARAKEASGQLGQAAEIRERGFARRSEFLDRMLWVTGENAREGYIRLHRPELDQFLSLVTRLNAADSGLKAINASLQRKGLLLKITSEIQQIAQLSKDPQLTELATSLAQARKELASLTLSGPTAETQGKHTEVLYGLEQEVNELQGELGRASVRYKSSNAQISVDELAKVLEEETVLIDFLTYTDGGQRKLLAGILKKEGGQVSSSMIVYDSMQEIEEVVLEYRSYIQDEDADEDEILEAGQLAYEKIWLPLREAVGELDHVYLVPDGILNILPFNALVDEEEEYLIQNLDLQILTSGRDLLPNEYRLAEGNYVILAGPDYDSQDVVSQEELREAQGRRSTALQLGLRGGASGLRGLNFNPLPGAEQEGD
ncbi:MAG TPA: tetratricopeptide repeat protein [Pseudomonadales bacterium]|jgi:tetratricopeptide (TPR) repeat protein|nr:tetratricopeptide repeat protein [Pseudomonadales bacterium]|tara:strand:- start:18544 stop:21768 length:3225 start_codon:yes stop_codon:yes gene_type:complete